MEENIKHHLEALEKYARILLDTQSEPVTLGQVSYLLRVVAEIAEASRREEILAMLEQKGA